MNIIDATVIVGRLSGIGVAAEKAAEIVHGALELIDDIEALAKDMAGSDKMDAVRAGVSDILHGLGLATEADHIWAVLKPKLSLVVKIKRVLGLFGATHVVS